MSGHNLINPDPAETPGSNDRRAGAPNTHQSGEKVMVDPENRSGVVPARLVVAEDQVQDALRRADTKATTLLSLVGLAMAGVIALGNRDMAGAGAVLVWLSLAPIFGSVVLLLAAIRPRLNQNPVPGTWLHAAQVGTATLLETYGQTDPVSAAAHVACLARIAQAKYRRVKVAVDLLVVGLVTLVVALVVLGVAR